MAIRHILAVVALVAGVDGFLVRVAPLRRCTLSQCSLDTSRVPVCGGRVACRPRFVGSGRRFALSRPAPRFSTIMLPLTAGPRLGRIVCGMAVKRPVFGLQECRALERTARGEAKQGPGIISSSDSSPLGAMHMLHVSASQRGTWLLRRRLAFRRVPSISRAHPQRLLPACPEQQQQRPQVLLPSLTYHNNLLPTRPSSHAVCHSKVLSPLPVFQVCVNPKP